MLGRTCFVILHYGDNVKITMDAVASIRKLQHSDNAEIVIVCNGKQWDLREKVDGCLLEGIRVEVLAENMGFSVGNNAGYALAKNSGDFDFIVVMNNDVVIRQPDFLERLQAVYNKHPFFVCGPDIYTPALAYHSNPMRKSIFTADELQGIIESREKQNRQLSRKFSFFGLKNYLIESFSGRAAVESFFKLWRIVKKGNNGYEREQSNVVLQGSCFIFSKDYIRLNEKAFEPEVFLYFEEYYLTQRCRENHWEMFYSPEIKVVHLHRGSSNLIEQNYRSYCESRKRINLRFIQAAREAKKILHGTSC